MDNGDRVSLVMKMCSGGGKQQNERRIGLRDWHQREVIEWIGIQDWKKKRKTKFGEKRGDGGY